MGSSSKEEPKQLEIRTGAQPACLVSGFDRFFERRAQLNSALATCFSLDWTHPTAEFSCGRCGPVHGFLS